MNLFQALFLDFQIQQLAILKPVEVGKSCIPQNMPPPIFLQILNALYKGFQMRYHLFQKFFGKMVKIKETSFLAMLC